VYPHVREDYSPRPSLAFRVVALRAGSLRHVAIAKLDQAGRGGPEGRC